MPKPIEQWRWVPGYEGRYQVSDRGRVLNTRSGRILRGGIDDDGYRRVTLSGKDPQETYRVHRLVALVFIGPVPEGKEVNHKDGIKTNNLLYNLEYVTDQEQRRHAIEMGLQKVYGEENPFARFTWKQIREIRNLCAIGLMPQTLIARMYGTEQSYISRIHTNQVWKE